MHKYIPNRILLICSLIWCCVGQMTAQPDNALELLKNAIMAIPDNYPQISVKQQIFYREVCWRNNKAVRLAEMNGMYMHDGYKPSGIADDSGCQLGMKTIRKSQNKQAFEMDFNGLDFILKANVVKLRNFFFDAQNWPKYDFEIYRTLDSADMDWTEIVFTAKRIYDEPLRNGRIRIDNNTLAFLEIEAALDSHASKYKKAGQQLKETRFLLKFEEQAPYFSLVYANRSFVYKHPKSKQKLTYFAEFFTKNETLNASIFSPNKTMKPQKDVFHYDSGYNKYDWTEFATTTEIPAFDEVIDDLEATKIVLEEQFQMKKKD